MQPLDDPIKRAQLKTMQRRASGLLVLATIVFVIARLLEEAYPWLGYVRATAEASMVGGLADWFAVTALFRHPLGIPIPHTAIVAARKEQVGRALGRFVQQHFLSPAVLSQRLASLRITEQLARWLVNPENSRTVAQHAAKGLASAARVLRDEDVQELIDGVLVRRVRETHVAPLLGRVLSVMTAGDRHQELLNEAIKLLARAVDENQELIRERIERETPWWVPDMVDAKIHQKIVTALDRTLREIRDDPRHELRARFDAALHAFIEKLHTSSEVQERAEQIKEELLDAQSVRRFSSGMWEEAKSAIIRRAESVEAHPPGAIESGIESLGHTLLNDPALMAKVDGWIASIALALVERYHGEVSALISQTVDSWDPQVTSQRIELAVGKDLQYIRINGTLVGGLAGLLIYVVSKFM
ncbi:MAG: DUF445 family protein [Anaerolineae bacterium]|nr:DUF445 family protein [Gemmatimonadaceae bacterium]